jgi:aryl-alcohol dehydrogenase-like predicted oxidoreductase
MRTVQIEGSALSASRLGLGTASLHHLLSARARGDLLAQAWEQGIRYFDTAPLYGHELAERELGRFMRGRRTDTVLASKAGLLPGALRSRCPPLMYLEKSVRGIVQRASGLRLNSGAPRSDYSAAYVRRRVERSLRVLRTDYIDILYLHEPTLTRIDEPLELTEALLQLQRAGKIRAFGLSAGFEACAGIAQAHPRLAGIVQLQVQPTLRDTRGAGVGGRRAQVTFGHLRDSKHTGIERALARACELNDRGVILFSTRSARHLQEVAASLAAIERGAQASAASIAAVRP